MLISYARAKAMWKSLVVKNIEWAEGPQVLLLRPPAAWNKRLLCKTEEHFVVLR